MNARPGLTAALLVVLAAAIYFPPFPAVHPALNTDELFEALTAQSIAATGHDLNGRFLPPLFQMSRPFNTAVWYLPIPIYGTAAVLRIFPLSESTIRAPMTMVGVIDLLLLYFIGRELFRRESLAIGAAVLLGVMPPHFAFSRFGMYFLAHVPFVLGWLLCVLVHFRRPGRRWLFGAGLLLGLGLYTYASAPLLMPLYFLLTCGVLYARHESRDRFGALAAGFVPAASIALVFLLLYSTAATDMFRHYQYEEGSFASGPAAAAGWNVVKRLNDYAHIYASFWNPHLWVTNRGPIRPLFVLPVAGLLVAAFIRLIRRPTLPLLLLVAGFALAPLPASIVPQPDKVNRVLTMLPFAALLAAMGLEYVWEDESPRARAIAYVLMWGTVIGLAMMYHAVLRDAQAYARVATVPLAVAGLGTVLGGGVRERGWGWQAAGVALAVLLALQIAYLAVDREFVMNLSMALLAAMSIAAIFSSRFELVSSRPFVAVAILAAVSALFVHVYVDYTIIPPVPFIRFSRWFPAVRFFGAAIAVAAVLWVSARLSTNRPSPTAAAAVLAFTEVAYFYIDYFPGFLPRLAQALAVLLGVAILAQLHRRAADRLSLGWIAAATVCVLAVLQFAPIYAEQNQRSRRQSADRIAFEGVLRRLEHRTVPAIYLANTGTLGEMYWRFYALKHGQGDLLPRTVADRETAFAFAPARVVDLPAGGVAVVGRSLDAADAIGRMAAAGQVTVDILRGPDGPTPYLMLERTSRR